MGARVLLALVAAALLAGPAAPMGPGGSKQQPDILFPDEYEHYAAAADKDWTLQLASRLSELHEEEVDDFLEQFPDEEDEQETFITSRFGNDKKSNGRLLPLAKHAACSPQPELVRLEPSPGAMLVPACTRVPRCSGCCSSALLSCRPTELAPRTFRAYELRVKSNSKTVSKKVVNVTVQEHVACQCSCRVRREDCAGEQQYEEAACRCACPQPWRAEACAREGRHWDHAACRCECEELEDCSSGAAFDHATCQCRRA